MERRVAILVAEGFTDSSLSVTLDVLRTANALAVRSGKSPLFRIDVASARGEDVRAASGLRIHMTRSAAVAARANVVLVPSIWVEDPAELDAVLERSDIQRFVRAIRSAHARGAIVGAGCSAAFLLAEAGLLDGREATTAWWSGPHLKRRRPQVDVNVERSLVVLGRVLCAGAVLAQADLALYLVSRFAGPETARRCAGLLLLDTHASQAPYMALQHLAASDPTVERAETVGPRAPPGRLRRRDPRASRRDEPPHPRSAPHGGGRSERHRLHPAAQGRVGHSLARDDAADAGGHQRACRLRRPEHAPPAHRAGSARISKGATPPPSANVRRVIGP